VIGEHEAIASPACRPVWDTTLACHALIEARWRAGVTAAKQGLDWLLPKQVLDTKGDCGP